ncbi:hypothetical protein FRB94_003008 [Tulasnella sp. JGI-2019a]|nr:hypothetical protein FRB94_003008 [Tulasnella sp. JGI-2019a]
MADTIIVLAVGGSSKQEGINHAIELPVMKECLPPGTMPTGWRYGRRADLLSSTGVPTIPGNPHDFKVVTVTWWKKRSGLGHEYIVLETEIQGTGSLSRVYVRMERHKWVRTSIEADDGIRVAAKEADLTEDSDTLVMFTIRNPIAAGSSYYTLASLGLFLEEVAQDVPRCQLPTLNCYWLAKICFECILRHYGQDNISVACMFPSTASDLRTGTFPAMPNLLREPKDISFAELLSVC